MNNTQTLLIFGAMLILSLTSLRFNKTVVNNVTVELENKVYLTAFSLADDMIEEAKTKAFDESTIKFPTTSTANLSTTLGPEGETYSSFDDVDDYNGYSKLVTAPHAEDYNISCRVMYVDGNDPDEVVSHQTFYKKFEVTVSSPYLRMPINLSFIFTLK